MIHGFLILDKPSGWTSHDVVARVRRLTGQKRAGHTGTLDPDATGVLIVCLGLATRLIPFIEDDTKAYRAVLSLGATTNTQDAGGRVLSTRDASHITEADLLAALSPFRGAIMQTPPMVSAVRHRGRRLYEYARLGEEVERVARPVTIHRLEASGFRPGAAARATLDVECSGGTYIRTLCNDIGASLGVGGHLESLRRTRAGPFTEAEAVSLERFTEAAGQGLASAQVCTPERLLPRRWPLLAGTSTEAEHLRHGRPIASEGEGTRAAFLHGGRLLALLRRGDDGQWWPERVFPPD